MLREHRGFSSGLVLEPPTEHRPHFADVFQLPVRLRVCCEQVFGYEGGLPALPISRERAGAPFTGGARGKAGLFVTFH